MKRTQWILVAAVAGAVVVGGQLAARGADAKAGPARVETPAAETKPARTAAVVREEWAKASKELDELMKSPADLLGEKRAELGPKVLPVLKRMEGLPAELVATKAAYPAEVAADMIRVQACLIYLGDAETDKTVTAQAAGDDKAALRAKVTVQLAAWWRAAKDEKAQGKILEEMQKLAADYPRDARVLYTLTTMTDIGGANEETSLAAEGIVAETMRGPDASFVKDVHAGHLKQRAAMNKAVEFAGRTVEGKDFSTAAYKGKVVLIDFWATWCHPCVAENPRIKAMYAKYHEKGLEVVGISCDKEGETLADYVKQENMPWVQMWDKKVQTANPDDAWNPVAKAWGVMTIPQMFLIDREGKLRSVGAREDMEKVIPKLLEEKAGGQ
jgi:peroxiredoxin